MASSVYFSNSVQADVVVVGEHGRTGSAVEGGREEGHPQGEVQGGPGLPGQAQEDHRGCE